MNQAQRRSLPTGASAAALAASGGVAAVIRFLAAAATAAAVPEGLGVLLTGVGIWKFLPRSTHRFENICSNFHHDGARCFQSTGWGDQCA